MPKETIYNFEGKTALITGAASGFGAATAKRLAVSGARIVAIDRNADKLRSALSAWPAVPAGPHLDIVADLRPAQAAADVVERAWTEAGPLDILINSAGVCHFHSMAQVTPEAWDEVHEIDVRSLFFMSVRFAERIDAQRGGRIINLGSNAGRKGRAISAPYAAAKAAVANLTESLALSYGPRNITVNTVCPAVVLTPLWDSSLTEIGSITGKTSGQLVESWRALTPLRRLGTVDDVAQLIAYLASDEAGFITGQEINVCGGFMLTC